MLVRLLPEQAANCWEEIKVAIELSLPPTVGMQSDRMSNILTGIMTEELTAWLLVNKDSKDILAIGLTSFLFDAPSGTKSMLIYCMYGYGGLPAPDLWRDGLGTLVKFAKGNGCHKIVAYSDQESVVSLAKTLGAETKYTFISFPLEQV